MKNLILILVTLVFLTGNQDPVKKRVIASATAQKDSTYVEVMQEQTKQMQKTVDSIELKLDQLINLMKNDSTRNE